MNPTTGEAGPRLDPSDVDWRPGLLVGGGQLIDPCAPSDIRRWVVAMDGVKRERSGGGSSGGSVRRMAVAAAVCILTASGGGASAAPAAPEPVSVRELPLPPTAPSADPGACTRKVNPRGTGCMSASEYGTLEGPSYMQDGHHVLLTVIFTGAPAAPNPASIYSGPQVIAIKTDGSVFSNGDAWKCLTCGTPAANAVGIHRQVWRHSSPEMSLAPRPLPVFDHPQPFPDDKRALAGTNVLDCGQHRLTDAACTPERLHIYPLRWDVSADGSGEGGSMRELRLHPDGVHLGWSSFVPPPRFDEYGFLGRIVFNPSPRTGPRVARYDIENVWVMLNTSPEYGMFMPDPKDPGQLLQNKPLGVIGEFRGFSSDGKAALGIGLEESGNMDLYATDLKTGESTRLTRDVSYTDPSKTSPDDRWLVYMNPRQSDRHMYYAGLRGIPPLADLLGLTVAHCCYNNGNRRFFQPYLLATDDTREDNPGQQLNAGPGAPGTSSDPNWNGRADPAWSPDGTRVVYWQALVTSPACGGGNPLPCPASTEPGGRRTRLMIATLTSRAPTVGPPAPLAPDAVGWGIPYHPGEPLPVRGHVQPGKFVLKGRASGSAEVEIRSAGEAVSFVSARYTNFSNDGRHIIDGTESVERAAAPGQFVWHSDIHANGAQHGSKVTSEPGGFVFGKDGRIAGTLTTTVDGRSYAPPQPGT